MERSLSIVGAGRVGRTLGKRLRRLGWRIGAVVSRSEKASRAAVRSIGAGKPHVGLSRIIFNSNVVLLTVPDTALAPIAQALARVADKGLKGKIVLHTSGALDRTVLRPLARRGAAVGSLHPMQTFSGRGTPNLNAIIFAVEGDPRAQLVARGIARALGGFPVAIKGKNKPAYHAAGALVAGHGLALVESAAQVLRRIGFTRASAAQALLPLMRQMLDNFERLGPRAAWTGPISRGDFAIVKQHKRAMQNHPREFQHSYAALSLLAGRVLAKNPSATLKQLKRALK